MLLIQFLITTLISLFLISFPLQATQTQIITWDETEISTLLRPGEPFAQAIFRTYNNGVERMRINHASSESNAIKTLIKKRIIEPGESSTIIVNFLPEGKGSGIYHNKINVFFEGHEEPLATLHHIVTIPKLIRCLPNIITWEDYNIREPFLVKLELDDRFVTGLSAVDYDKSLYDVSLIPDKDHKFKYTLKIVPIKEDRPFNSIITIKASGAEVTDAKEPIFLFNTYSLNQ